MAARRHATTSRALDVQALVQQELEQALEAEWEAGYARGQEDACDAILSDTEGWSWPQAS